MGRTTPTYVQQAAEIIANWSAKFRRALRREDRVHFDRMTSSIRYYSPSGMVQCSDDPREAVVLSILLDLERRVDKIEKRLDISLELREPETGDLFSQIAVAPEKSEESD
jgi:hypothetical protein